jgi:predicted HTH domain antitoxin
LKPAFSPVRFDALTQVGFDSLPLAGEGDTLPTAMSKQVIVELPEGAFSAFRSEPAELGREMRLAASVKWYELGRLTQAKAAEFAGLSRYEFIHALGRFGASPLQETVEELAETLNRER